MNEVVVHWLLPVCVSGMWLLVGYWLGYDFGFRAGVKFQRAATPVQRETDEGTGL